MLTNPQRKQINNAFYRLTYRLDNKTWTHHMQIIFKAELADEKQHRGSDTARFHCTPTEAAKYFAVKHIFDGLTAHVEAKDLLHLRYGYVYGAGCAQEFREDITAEFTPEEIADFLTLDYVKMIEA